MKRKVVYIKALYPLQVGVEACVIPLNHTSDLVQNGHACTTTPVVSIAQDGTTFETQNSIYVLAPEQELTDDDVDNVLRPFEVARLWKAGRCEQ